MKLHYFGIVAGALALGAFTVPLTGMAETREIRVLVDVPPPPAKVTTAPSTTKAGYVWSPGYWKWSGSDYVWTDGTWVQVVESKKWVQPTWTQDGTKWYFTAGHWE